MQPSSGPRCLIFGRPVVYFHTSCVRTVKALVRLSRCAGSLEPSLFAYVISTLISWAGSFYLTKFAECCSCVILFAFFPPSYRIWKTKLGRIKRILYLLPMRAAKVQGSLRIRAVSPEPPLLAHTSSESRGTFRQKAISLAPLDGWACAVKICHDGMLEDTNSLDAAQIKRVLKYSPAHTTIKAERIAYRIRNTILIGKISETEYFKSCILHRLGYIESSKVQMLVFCGYLWWKKPEHMKETNILGLANTVKSIPAIHKLMIGWFGFMSLHSDTVI